MILAMYDLSGIQKYVYSTNKLKEIIGGSEIVNCALFKILPEAIGCDLKNEYWKDESIEFKWSEAKKTPQIVFIGGGVSLVTYPNQNVFNDATVTLQKNVFLKSGGGLNICFGYVEVKNNNDKKLKFYDIYNELRKNLEASKNSAHIVSAAKGFSLNAHNNTTFEPIIIVEENQKNVKCDTRSNYQKFLANKIAKEGKTVFGELESKTEKQFVLNFDDYRNRDNDKNYLAIVHIDGNQTGKRIKSHIQKISNEKGATVERCLSAMRKLSVQISNAYCFALIEAVKSICWRTYDGKIDFRPVVVDGDDITVICGAANAIAFVERFMEQLSKNKISNKNKPTAKDKLTAAAGIAFVKHHFPFYTAYSIADQLCGNAKRKTIQRKINNANSLDFYICDSGVLESVEDFRKKNCEFGTDNNKLSLCIRPYVFADGNYSYKKYFDEPSNTLMDLYEDHKNKLKGLMAAYGKGPDETETYGELLKARAALDKDKKQIMKIAGENVFSYINNKKYAAFFDILDVLDLINPAAEGE